MRSPSIDGFVADHRLLKMARLVADCAENAAHGADFHWGQGWGRRWSAGELFGLGRGSSTARHSLRENCDLANRKSKRNRCLTFTSGIVLPKIRVRVQIKCRLARRLIPSSRRFMKGLAGRNVEREFTPPSSLSGRRPRRAHETANDFGRENRPFDCPERCTLLLTSEMVSAWKTI